MIGHAFCKLGAGAPALVVDYLGGHVDSTTDLRTEREQKPTTTQLIARTQGGGGPRGRPLMVACQSHPGRAITCDGYML